MVILLAHSKCVAKQKGCSWTNTPQIFTFRKQFTNLFSCFLVNETSMKRWLVDERMINYVVTEWDFKLIKYSSQSFYDQL